MDKDFSIMKNLEKKSLNEFFFITWITFHYM
jgi:hypothetical protein